MSETIYETQVAPARQAEEERVTRWRIEQLLGAGYDGEAALIIGLDTSIDLHQATELLRAGCPIDTALQILF
jgi:hypothetical protein